MAAYREHPIPASASDLVQAVWSVTFAEATEDWLVIPDGCVDVVLVPDAPVLVAGPASGPLVLSYPAGTVAAGLRLLPGAAPALLGLAASELVDQLVPLAGLGLPPWPDDLARAHAAVHVGAPGESARRLAAALGGAQRPRRLDVPIRAATDLLRRDPTVPVSDIAARLALSERQLRRRFTEHVGLAPKPFAGVMRLQGWLALHRRHPRASIGWSAAQAGYADQAHLVRESHRFAGRTPGALLRQRAAVSTEPAEDPDRTLARSCHFPRTSSSSPSTSTGR